MLFFLWNKKIDYGIVFIGKNTLDITDIAIERRKNGLH